MNIRRVKRFEEGLYRSVLHLLPQLDENVEPPSREFFAEVLESGSNFFFVAETDRGEIAGILTLVSYPNITGRKFWIEDVVVDNAFRGQGAGEQLTRSAIGFARAQGATELKLTSRPFREAANRLYQKLGFKKYDTNIYKYKL